MKEHQTSGGDGNVQDLGRGDGRIECTFPKIHGARQAWV